MLVVGQRDIERHARFGSAYLEPRHIDVFLPPGYDGDDSESYSVLYAHDGQNLFNPEMSYTGIDWGVDEALEALLAEGKIRKTIVVGIWNTPKRSREYQPRFVRDLSDGSTRRLIDGFIGGASLSDDYLRFITTELKPFIDRNYRTKPGREDTFLMGSSMGGLISLYGMQLHPDVFSGAACLSTHWPAVFGDGADSRHTESMLTHLRTAFEPLADRRWYFDFGTTELDANYEGFQLQVDSLLRELGYAEEELWITRKFEGAGHSERFWRERVHIPLEFLLRPE
ncbi:MAG: alpha/beta hydrolase-fold protein [Pseudomonadota bacterium]